LWWRQLRQPAQPGLGLRCGSSGHRPPLVPPAAVRWADATVRLALFAAVARTRACCCCCCCCCCCYLL